MWQAGAGQTHVDSQSGIYCAILLLQLSPAQEVFKGHHAPMKPKEFATALMNEKDILTLAQSSKSAELPCALKSEFTVYVVLIIQEYSVGKAEKVRLKAPKRLRSDSCSALQSDCRAHSQRNFALYCRRSSIFILNARSLRGNGENRMSTFT